MKVGGDQVVLVPQLPIFGGDASHGSHRVVAPMATYEKKVRVNVFRGVSVYVNMKLSNKNRPEN